MNSHAQKNREQVRHWMMAALDGELAQRERSQLDRILQADPELQSEWERLSRTKEMMKMFEARKPPPEVWQDYWQTVYNRVERGIGWILFSVGLIVLCGYGLWQAVDGLLADTQMPSFLKAALFAMGLGAIILALSVIREKLFTRRRDPYKEIER